MSGLALFELVEGRPCVHGLTSDSQDVWIPMDGLEVMRMVDSIVGKSPNISAQGLLLSLCVGLSTLKESGCKTFGSCGLSKISMEGSLVERPSTRTSSASKSGSLSVLLEYG